MRPRTWFLIFAAAALHLAAVAIGASLPPGMVLAIEPVTTAALIAGGASLLGGMASKGKKPKAGFTDDSFYDKDIQRFLPLALRAPNIDPTLNKGFAGIAELIANPGRLSGNVAQSIAPRLAIESSRIANDFSGMRANQAGQLARGNAPVSIKTALETMLARQEGAAQGELRRNALMESEQLRRADLGQTYDILGAIQGLINPRLGVAGPLQGQMMAQSQQNAAANQAALASLAGALGNINWGGSKNSSVSNKPARGQYEG